MDSRIELPGIHRCCRSLQYLLSTDQPVKEDDQINIMKIKVVLNYDNFAGN